MNFRKEKNTIIYTSENVRALKDICHFDQPIDHFPYWDN
jgi:hypothetical protein